MISFSVVHGLEFCPKVKECFLANQERVCGQQTLNCNNSNSTTRKPQFILDLIIAVAGVNILLKKAEPFPNANFKKHKLFPKNDE